MSEDSILRGGDQPAAPSLDDIDFSDIPKRTNSSGLRALPEELEENSEPSVSSIMLDDLGSEEEMTAKQIKSDLLGDDDFMDDDDITPEIEDLSKDIKPTYDKAKSLAAQPKLQKSEKELLKEQLQREINSTPTTVDKKESLQMYNKLMEEKKLKSAKKGFGMAVLVMILGFVDAGIIYFISTMNPENDFISMQYAILLFAISFLLMIRAKFIRNLEILLFTLNTIVLIGPGLVKQAVAVEQHAMNFNTTMVMYGIAIIISGFCCFQLITNNSIEAYYTMNLSNKKVYDENKTRYNQR